MVMVERDGCEGDCDCQLVLLSSYRGCNHYDHHHYDRPLAPPPQSDPFLPTTATTEPDSLVRFEHDGMMIVNNNNNNNNNKNNNNKKKQKKNQKQTVLIERSYKRVRAGALKQQYCGLRCARKEQGVSTFFESDQSERFAICYETGMGGGRLTLQVSSMTFEYFHFVSS